MARRLWFLIVALTAAAGGGWLATAPAHAQPDRVEGGAFALSVASGTGTLVAPTPGGVSGAGTGGFPPLSASRPTVSLPGVVTAAGLAASTDGRPGGGGSAAVTSTASVDGLSLLGGLLDVARLSSSCSATAAGAAGSSLVEGLTVGGTAVPAAPAPNTVVEIPGVARAVLNEQVADSGAGRSGLTVRAAHLEVVPGQGGPALVDVVVAESHCLVTPGGPPPPPPTAPSSTILPPTTIGPPPTAPVTTAVPPVTTTTVAGPDVMPPSGGGGMGNGPSPQTGQAVRATSAAGANTGTAGSEVDVSGSGFEGCSDVRLLFDDARIGTARPDAAGAVDERGLWVPGDATTGRHGVTATCRAGDHVLRATAAFDVVSSATHRSAFVTALAEPRQIGTSARSLALSAVAALGLLLAIAFPSELFNSTLDENYDEVRGWFRLRPVAAGSDAPGAEGGGRHQGLAFVAFVLLGGLLYGFLTPDLAFDRSSVALVLGLSLSLVVISVGFRLPQLVYVRRRDGEWARFRVLPGTALVAVACVVLSRLVHFQPGYLYGLIAGLSFRRRLDTDTNGVLTAASAVAVFLISIAAWLARVPVSSAAARPHASIWIVALEACLAAISVLGLETVVICLIPLRFVEGSKVAAWSRTAWAVVFGLCAFAFVHILLRPDSGYVAASSSRWTVFVLFVAFGILSVGFWAYFRFRPARPPSPVAA